MSIKAIHTPCKNCVFAKYENQTQTDCHLDFLNKFANKNIEIIEAYDEEKEFNIINGKKCHGYKENKYFIARNLENTSIEEKISYVKNLFKINYTIILNIKNFNNEELKAFATTIKALSIKPKNIVLIRYQEDKKTYGYKFLNHFFEECGQLDKWKIQTVIDPEETQENIVHKIINTNKDSRFIMYINKDYSDFDKIIEYAQKCIYEDLSTFEILSNSNKDSVLFNSSVYSYGIYYGYNILHSDKYEIIK